MNYHLTPLSDHGIIIELGQEINTETFSHVQVISTYLEEQPFQWMIEYVPAFTTVTIYYDPKTILLHHSPHTLPFDYVKKQVSKMLNLLQSYARVTPSIIEVPVCYGGEWGPDIEIVASRNHLSVEEVIRIHTSTRYQVYMIGFAPGFPYLGGLPKELATPRKSSPRLAIPAGSVGIAGNQTGIYPLETPGGWQIIGNTPLQLFRPMEDPPCLLKAGDQIIFKSISKEEFHQWEDKLQV
ncbi:5-oxoprolinase subunit PxpB [Niallia sp. XMNu-256]|uniref:5-oxoprolinase subunit PxpB n=1 Tax=Niallia sp. XMNu-256 TaxID=3082444 RepID=UPI0030CB4861